MMSHTEPAVSRRKLVKSQSGHPDHSDQKKRLNRIKGQINGVERMIDERRYCVDIVNQIRAVRSALKSLEDVVLEKHLRACVRSTLKSRDQIAIETKIDEIMDLLA